MATSIAAKGLVKEIGGATIVDDVSFDVAPGELFFLLGPSGCGKTTTLRMLAGLSDPNAGQILFDARDITGLPPRKRNIGMVFQNFALWPHMTAAENVEFGLRSRGMPARERRQRVAKILDEVDLGGLADRRPSHLSGGQQQRVALARALVVEPNVLLLDEPLSNLDANLRVQLRELIRDLCRRANVTTVYVTHDQEEALSLADDIAVMRDGHLLQVGSPEVVYTRPNSSFVAKFLGETNLQPATLRERDGDRLVLDTPLGTLISSVPAPALAPGVQGVCSIRPEAIRRGSGNGENAIHGRAVRTDRHGRWQRHTVRVEDNAELVCLEPVTGRHWPEDVVLEVDPADIVMLAESTT